MGNGRKSQRSGNLQSKKFSTQDTAQLKSPPGRSSTCLEFAHPDVTIPGRLVVFLDPTAIGQVDFGLRDWLHADLVTHFEAQTPRGSTPIVNCLAYDHLWHGRGSNDAGCWDAITESNLDQSMSSIVEASQRLVALAARINALAALEQR